MKKKGSLYSYIFLAVLMILVIIGFYVKTEVMNYILEKYDKHGAQTPKVQDNSSRENNNITGAWIINESISVNSMRLYPNRTLTPGRLLTTNKSIICNTGYSATVRDVNTAKKKEVYARYNIPYPQTDIEVDHWYSLCLGGSNDVENLWIEPGPEYKWKDVIETKTCRELCSTNMTVEEAASRMWRWYDLYLEYNATKKMG